jgi:hypothetical protein
MNKEELIRFLEPFTDECEIRIEVAFSKRLVSIEYVKYLNLYGEGYAVLVEES